MANRPTARDFSDHPSRLEQMAHLWHELHRRDATHPRRIDDGWWDCRACRRFNPHHRPARMAGLQDIKARLVDSMASTNTTQIERKSRKAADNWRRRGT